MTRPHPSAKFRETRRSLPIALLRAREAVMTPIREMLAESPLNEQKWRAMRVIDEGGPMDQTDIARSACLLLPSLTRILQSLESDGLLTRHVHPDDRRKTLVELTDKGRATLERYADRSRDILDGLGAKLGPEKLETLLSLLDELQRLPPDPENDANSGDAPEIFDRKF